MTPKRWIYLGVLGVSLLALLMDRFVLSEPEAADAASIVLPPRPQQQPASTVRSTLAPQTASTPGGTVPILGRLRALPSPAVIRDAFALSGDFLAASPGDARPASEAERRRQALAASFPTQHKLQTTLISGSEALAIVDGQVLRLGQVVDGLTLCRVESNRATFCDETNTPAAVLTLDPPN